MLISRTPIALLQSSEDARETLARPVPSGMVWPRREVWMRPWLATSSAPRGRLNDRRIFSLTHRWQAHAIEPHPNPRDQPADVALIVWRGRYGTKNSEYHDTVRRSEVNEARKLRYEGRQFHLTVNACFLHGVFQMVPRRADSNIKISRGAREAMARRHRAGDGSLAGS